MSHRLAFFLLLIGGFGLVQALVPGSAFSQSPPLERSVLRNHLQARDVLRAGVVDLPPTVRQLPSDSAANGTITGQLLGLDPNAKATVTAIGIDASGVDSAWGYGEVAPDGFYRIGHLSAGSYVVLAQAEGYVTKYFPDARTISDAEALTVTAEGVAEGIDIPMEPAVPANGRISGTVFDGPDGDPVARAEVTALHVDQPFHVAYTVTAEDGSYTLSDLQAGSYYVLVRSDGFFPAYYDGAATLETATPVDVEDPGETTGIDFHLDRGGSVSGRIVDGDGAPIEGAVVNVSSFGYYYGEPIPVDPIGGYPPDDSLFIPPESPGVDTVGGYWSGWAVTGPDGRYVVSGLGTDEYTVYTQVHRPWYTVTEWYDDASTPGDAEKVPVELGEETSGIDFEIELLSTTGSLAGTVQSADGEPVYDATVTVQSWDSLNVPIYAYAQIEPDGTYRLDDLPAGRYRVGVEFWREWYRPPLWYDGVWSPEDATPVVIEENRTTEGIDFRLPATDGVIRGVVTDRNDRPMPRALVQASPVDWNDPRMMPIWGGPHSVTDENGVYEMLNLPDGRYHVYVYACQGPTCIERWWPDAPSPDQAGEVVIENGVTTPVTVDFKLPLERGTGAISGTVLRADGQALQGAQLLLMADASVTPDSNVFVHQYQVSDQDGRYRFEDLPPGTYFVQAAAWHETAFAEQWYDGAATREEATPIVLERGEVREAVDFTLELRPRYGRISGTVVDAGSGTAVARAYVEVTPLGRAFDTWAFWQAEFHAITDEAGRFEIDWLPEGVYSVDGYAENATSRHKDAAAGNGSQTVEVIGGETASFDLAVQTHDEGPGSLSGRVQSEDESALEIAVVVAQAADRPDSVQYATVTRPDGTYGLEGLPPGSYLVKSFAPWHIDVYYDQVWNPEEATRVEVGEGPGPTGIDFTLTPVFYLADGTPAEMDPAQAVIVHGSVKDADGEALNGATVYALDEAGNALASARVQRDGMYEFGALPPGGRFQFMATRSGFETQYFGENTGSTRGAVTTLGAGRHAINFVLSEEGTSTPVEPGDELPDAVTLGGNYPNPFNPTTRIVFTLPRAMTVTVDVIDVLGRRVARLYNGTLQAGEQHVVWDTGGREMSSGLYFYRINADGAVHSGSMVLMR